MIDFRYHVVSIVAVFLALALGLFIGSTSLREPVANDIRQRTSQVVNENGQLHGDLSTAQGQLKKDQSFAAALAPFAVGSRLAGQSVVVVSAPGVESSMRKSLVAMLTTAGATVTGDVRLQSALLDPKQDQFLTTLTGRLQIPGHALPTGATGAQRAAAQLADVLGTRPGGRPVPTQSAASVLSAYSDGQLVSLGGGTARPGSLALVLAAPPATGVDPQVQQSANATLLELARDLDTSAVGAVIVGPAVAADAGGLLAAARADKTVTRTVSTVDTADQPSGQITAVFALAEQVDGRSGNYGAAAGADAPLPTPSPTS